MCCKKNTGFKYPTPTNLGQSNIYIYIIYTPNLGFQIAVLGWEREQGRFRRSTGEHRGSTEEAPREREVLAPR